MSTPPNPAQRPLRTRRSAPVEAVAVDDAGQLIAPDPPAARPSSVSEPPPAPEATPPPMPVRRVRRLPIGKVQAPPVTDAGQATTATAEQKEEQEPAPATPRSWLDRLLARPDLLLLAAIVFFALAIRLFNLGSFPDTFSADESDNTEDALRIIHGMPPQNGFFGFDWKPQPAFSVYLLSFFLRLLGPSMFAARLPSALISVAALIPFYFLLRRQFSLVAALLGTFLLATNLWYLNFSRSAWENVHIAFYMLMTMLFLLFALDGLRKKSTARWWVWLCFIATGFFCALGLYGYFGGRAIILAVVAYFPVALWFYRRRWGWLLAGYLLVGSVAIILLWPQLAYTLQPDKWTFFNRRSDTVLLFNTAEYKSNPLGTIMSQIGTNIRGIWFTDNAPLAGNFLFYIKSRYVPNGSPLLDPVTGLLVFVGFVLSFALTRLRRRPETYLWWVMLIICWAFTEVVTTSTPDGARGVGWMPALIYFATIAIEAGVLFAARLRAQRWLPIAIAVAVILIVGINNINNYVYWQSLDYSRYVRAPYIADCEFPDWAALVIDHADKHMQGFAVSDWLGTHPHLKGFAVLPCGANATASTAPPATPSGTPVGGGSNLNPPVSPFIPPTTPRQQWLPSIAAIGKNAPAAQGKLTEPRAVAVDQAGNVYVADSAASTQTITKYDSNGKFLLTWGGKGGPSDNDKFEGLWAIAIDKAGEVLTLDQTDYWVRVFDQNGKFIRKWGGPDTRMYHPRAMSIDAKDNVYIADSGGKRILRYTTQGRLQQELADQAAGVALSEQVVEPGGVAGTADGGFFVADSGAHLIRRYNTVGQQQNSWSFAAIASTNGPRLAVAPDGSLYVATSTLCSIIHYDANGIAKDEAGNCDSKDYLSQPSGLTIANGKLYVTDLDQKAVRVFALSPSTAPPAPTTPTIAALATPIMATSTLTSTIRPKP